MADSPGSTLSSIASDEFTEDLKLEDAHQSDSPRNMTPRMPPAKRRRTGVSTYREDHDHQTPISSAHEVDQDEVPASPSSTISSDTDGDMPDSPQTGYTAPDEDGGVAAEQVTICRWDGCKAGDMGNMDRLVKHIKDVHIGTRQKRYACEWIDCSRKGTNHASGYALRAHMRSHTKEKPFYCSLPECDRSFTRSDALAKHMRTVHETEALRPSDPVPKHHPTSLVTPAHAPPTNTKNPRIRLVFASKSSTADSDHGYDGDSDNHHHRRHHHNHNNNNDDDPYPPDMDLTRKEASLSPNELYRLLRRQVAWAQEAGEELREEASQLDLQRRTEGMKNGLVMDELVMTMMKIGEAAGLDMVHWAYEQQQQQQQQQSDPTASTVKTEDAPPPPSSTA